MKQLLVLNIPPELEDELVDFLMTIAGAGGFTSYPVRGHGEQKRPSVAEQVTGRRKRVQFELILASDAIEHILENIREQVGTDIYYWQQAIIAAGRV